MLDTFVEPGNKRKCIFFLSFVVVSSRAPLRSLSSISGGSRMCESKPACEESLEEVNCHMDGGNVVQMLL